MKTILQLACVVLIAQLAWAAQGPIAEPYCDAHCPTDFPIVSNWRIPFAPLQCEFFCHCANNGNWKMACPEGLHFNPTLQVCDWPQNAGCATTGGGGGGGNGGGSGSGGVCASICPAIYPIVANNHLPIPGSPTQFCHCANDGNHLKDCPAGLEFDAKLQVCNWPWAI